MRIFKLFKTISIALLVLSCQQMSNFNSDAIDAKPRENGKASENSVPLPDYSLFCRNTENLIDKDIKTRCQIIAKDEQMKSDITKVNWAHNVENPEFESLVETQVNNEEHSYTISVNSSSLDTKREVLRSVAISAQLETQNSGSMDFETIISDGFNTVPSFSYKLSNEAQSGQSIPFSEWGPRSPQDAGSWIRSNNASVVTQDSNTMTTFLQSQQQFSDFAFEVTITRADNDPFGVYVYNSDKFYGISFPGVFSSYSVLDGEVRGNNKIILQGNSIRTAGLTMTLTGMVKRML